MQPYYQDELVTLFYGDCREILPSLSADVLVCDPPYGVGMDSFLDDFTTGLAGVDAAPGIRAAIFHSPRLVMRFSSALKTWQSERLLWMHKVADIAAPWRGWSMNSEAILIASRERKGWPDPETYRSDVYTVGPWERSGHPCAKPMVVVTDLVCRLANQSDVVIDPFCGSGTTLRAAKDQGIKSIGIEVDEAYCELAARRMSQGTLAEMFQ